jgi:hypothetical protein
LPCWAAFDRRKSQEVRVTKKKLFDDIKQNPARIYRSPGDVLRDRRFGDAERLEILQAWRDAKTDPAERAEIEAMIAALEGGSDPISSHAAE